MPKINTRDRPDMNDLADDHIRRLDDGEVRDALLRMSEQLKAQLLYLEQLISVLYAAVTAIEEE